MDQKKHNNAGRTMPAPDRLIRQQGVVLPVALILLVIVSFVGVFAARDSATYEQFSNNIRTTQVARQAAEAALRYCEQIAIDKTENEGLTYAETSKIFMTELADPLDTTAIWNTKANWKAGAANLITVNMTHGTNVQDEAKIKNQPTCIIQRVQGERYLITSRGFSNDAELDAATGQITNGSEIWLQSLLTPGSPMPSTAGGNQ